MKLGDLIIDITLTPLIKKDDDGDLRLLKASAIVNGIILEQYLDRGTYVSGKDISKYLLKIGDIVFQAKGNRFEAIVIDKEYNNMVSSQIYFNLRVDRTKVEPEYLCWYLNSRLAKVYFDANTSGSVVKAINKKVLLDLEVKLPADNLKQQQIIEIVSEFELEKRKTLKYLIQKKLLVNEKIIRSLI